MAEANKNSTVRIDQILAGFAEGDAISHEAMIFRRVFRELGYESDIYVVGKCIAPAVRDRCRSLSEYDPSGSDVVMHHYSLASEAADVFINAPGKKVMRYQNITPAHYFQGFDDTVYRQLEEGRAKLKHTADASDYIWPVSEFNASELRKLKLENCEVLHLLFDPDRFDQPVAESVQRKFMRPLKNILFVGRIVPNKMIEDLIMMFAWYNRVIDPFSRLMLVGSEHSCNRYYTMLRMLTVSLDVPNICFEGFASESGLATYYRLADAFVCTSEHEGYCLPLVEAMYHNVPVVAKNAGGMPEALGGAGVLYEDASPRELAELLHDVLYGREMRDRVLGSQRRRMHTIRERRMKDEVKKLLGQVLA